MKNIVLINVTDIPCQPKVTYEVPYADPDEKHIYRSHMSKIMPRPQAKVTYEVPYADPDEKAHIQVTYKVTYTGPRHKSHIFNNYLQQPRAEIRKHCLLLQ